MTQEFHISVTPVGQNDYLVRTEEVAPGVPLAEELVTWPVAEWLTAAGHLMNDPLTSVFQSEITHNSVNLVTLGQQLYNALFQGTLRDSWIAAQSIAQNHQQVLRLRLGLKDNRLARLPWEVMHDSRRPIATGPYISFSRYQSRIGNTSRWGTANVPMLPDDGAIRVLMVIASPTDLVRLDLLNQEAIKLRAELHHRQTPRINEHGNYLPEIELTVLEQPGREELTQALEQGKYHILHYSGHSDVGANGGAIYLVNNRTGLTEALTGDDLAGLLVNNNIQMAVFNSCLGAGATLDNLETGESNLTETLVKRGIKSVLAMSERIPDDVAVTLTQLFYRNLSQGYALDLCVSRVRQGLITAYSAHEMFWALPILYLQSDFNGYLCPEMPFPQITELLGDVTVPLQTTGNIYSQSVSNSDMPLPIEDITGSALRDSSDLDWLGDDTWDDDFIGDVYAGDSSYEEDSAIVSELFNQLDQHSSNTELSYSDTSESVPSAENSQSSSNQFSNKISGEIASVTSQTVSWDNWDDSQDSSLLSLNPVDSGITNTAATTTTKRKHKPRAIVGVMGASALAFVVGVSMWGLSQRPQQPEALPISTKTETQAQPKPGVKQSFDTKDIKTAPTGMLITFATDKINQGDLNAGLMAVEELLNRSELPKAQAILDLIPAAQLEDPAVNFYKGRLIWQLIQTGDKKYSFDDARLLWEAAAKRKPDSVLYKNALGFAFYAEGNLLRANDAWFRGLKLAVEQRTSQKDTLTAYAGLALGLYKSVDDQFEASKRDRYLSEAIKFRQKVVREAPENFQADQLKQDWLWTEKAIGDWKSLLNRKSGQQKASQ